MVKNKIGGITTPRSISFVGINYKIKIKDIDGSFIIKKNNNISYSKNKNSIKTKPFIRGFYKMFDVIEMTWSTLFGKIFLSFFGFIYFISVILSLLLPEPNTAVVPISTKIVISMINIFFYFIILYIMIKVRPLHGLEHKILKTYNKNLKFNIKNILKQPRAIPQCGGTFLGIIIVTNLIINLFNLPNSLIYLLIPSLCYELFLKARGNNWYNKMLFFPGFLIQQLTTSNNIKKERIKKYIMGFKCFIAKEDPEYYKNKC